MAVTKTFTGSNSGYSEYAIASGYLGTPTVSSEAVPYDGDFYYIKYYPTIPRSSSSRFVTLQLGDLPSNAVVTNVHISYSISDANSLGVAVTKGITTPGISGSGSIETRVLNYLNQTPKPTSIEFGFFTSFNSSVTKSYYEKLRYTHEHEGQNISDTLTVASITLDITYEEPEPTGTISFGINNEWQKCNVYFGTGGEWKQCKAFFGVDGAWKETQ